MQQPDGLISCLTKVFLRHGILLQRKDSEQFIDGALCPSRAQKVLEVLHLSLSVQLFQVRNSSAAVTPMSKGRVGQDSKKN